MRGPQLHFISPITCWQWSALGAADFASVLLQRSPHGRHFSAALAAAAAVSFLAVAPRSGSDAPVPSVHCSPLCLCWRPLASDCRHWRRNRAAPGRWRPAPPKDLRQSENGKRIRIKMMIIMSSQKQGGGLELLTSFTFCPSISERNRMN